MNVSQGSSPENGEAIEHTPCNGFERKSQDCVVVVASCDKYSDLLAPFSSLWGKFWPDCPYRIVLVTETKPAMDGLCFNEVLAMGKGHSWGWRLSRALKRIDASRILLLCDDYFLCAPVDTSQIALRMEQSIKLDALNLRLIPNPDTAEPRQDDKSLGTYRKNTAYCIATQAGIWDRLFLTDLAGRTESIWEFERQGSFSFDKDDGRPILCTLAKEFPFVDAVHKGYWEPFGIRLCREQDVAIDFVRRSAPPAWVAFKEWVKGVVFRISPGLIVRIQNRLGWGWKEKRQRET